MGTGLLKRHLDPPAHHDPVQDLLRGGVQIGTEERGTTLFLRVPYQDPANGHGGHARGIPQRGAGEDPEPFTLAPVPLHGRLLPGRVGAGRPRFSGSVAVSPWWACARACPAAVEPGGDRARHPSATARPSSPDWPHTPGPAPRRQSRHPPLIPGAVRGASAAFASPSAAPSPHWSYGGALGRDLGGQHSTVKNGNAHTRWAQGTGTSNIRDTHLSPKHLTTCLRDDRTASR